MFCVKCGSPVEQGWAFCPKCGAGNAPTEKTAAPQSGPVGKFSAPTPKGQRSYSPGFLSNIKVTVDDQHIRYRGAYGGSSVIPVKNLTAITTSEAGFGKSDIVFVGQGAELARVASLPANWAEDIMVWLTKEINL